MSAVHRWCTKARGMRPQAAVPNAGCTTIATASNSCRSQAWAPCRCHSDGEVCRREGRVGRNEREGGGLRWQGLDRLRSSVEGCLRV